MALPPLLPKLAVVTALAAGLAACAPMQQMHQMSWLKPGAGYDAFMKDRYACVDDARSIRSGGFVYHGIGAANSGEVINGAVFVSCMGARGWQPDQTGATGFRAPIAIRLQ